MSTVWNTSDWHIGHKNIMKYRAFTGFKTREALEDMIFECHKSLVGKRDVTYFHGDMCFDHGSLERFKELKGTKLLILGNHDDHLSARDFLEVFDDIVGPIKYKGVWLTHQPMHYDELYGKPNVHGHTHNQFIRLKDGSLDKRYINVCVDVTNLAPVKFEDIVARHSSHKN